MLTHDGRRTSEDARRRTKIDTCGLFILVCNYFQWNQISFYNYYSWRWRYINIYRSHDRIIYLFNMWKNSRSLTLETNYRDVYFSEYWVVLHHVIRQYFKWKYKWKKNNFKFVLFNQVRNNHTNSILPLRISFYHLKCKI